VSARISCKKTVCHSGYNYFFHAPSPHESSTYIVTSKIDTVNNIGGNIYICVETVNFKSDYAIDLLLVCFIIIV